MTYAVKLEVFEGPLDLLLTLIERQELDITVVSLAKVTGQYLDYIRQLQQVSPEILADFVVVAAKLIYIKSLALLPRPPGPEQESGEDEDVGEDLARQLREYRRFREIARALDERLESGLHTYIRIAPPPLPAATSFRLEGVTLEDLLQAARQAFHLLPAGAPVSELVAPLRVTVDDQMNLVRRYLGTACRVPFSTLLRHVQTRAEIVVTLLAALEMTKRQEVVLYQEELFGEIWIEASSSTRESVQAHPEAVEAT